MRRFLLSLCCLLASLASSVLAQSSPDWPRGDATGAPLIALLDSLSSEIGRGDYGYIDRVLVIQSGRLVADVRRAHDYDAIYGDSARTPGALNAGDFTGPYNYFNDWWHPYYRRSDLHSLQSVTKTITSVVVGTAVTRGEFPDLDTPVMTFFDAARVENVDDRKRRLTIRHLLTMTGGLAWDEGLPYTDPRNDAVAMEASHDWVQYTIDLPMAREPGTRFNYSSGESQLLAHVFHVATGVDIEEYAARHLFAPLGITQWFWKRSPRGLVDTEGGLYLRAEDVAKIWQLFLRDGTWDNVPVVSPEWVRASVTSATSTGSQAGAPDYGLLWWLYANPAEPEETVWVGRGFGGQFPMAFPDADVVVMFNGWNILPGQSSLPLVRTMERFARALAGGQ